MATLLYFAYGSNMCTSRLAERAPSAKRVAVGYVEGRRLTFDKVARDGSGKCDVAATGVANDRVHGVVFEIDAADRDSLDRVEGVGKGYEVEMLRVITPGRVIDAFAYVATAKDPSVQPHGWYKDLVLAGATEHGLPSDYIAAIEGVVAR